MRNGVALSVWLLGAAGVAAEETANHWIRAGGGLSAEPIVAVAADPDQAARLWAADRQAVYESTDDGATWHERFRAPAQITITSLAVQADQAFAATTSGLYGSKDGGTTWARMFRGLGDGEANCTKIAIQPQHPMQAVLATHGGLFVSSTDRQRWTELRIPQIARDIRDFAFDPQQSSRLYLLTASGVFTGSLNGHNWQQLRGMLETSLDEEPPTLETGDPESSPARFAAITIDPQAPHAIYLAGTHGVQVSPDGGKSWRSLIGSMPAHRLLALSRSPTALYLATDQGIVRYQPSNNQWTPLTQGHAITIVHDLAVAGRTLWAATEQGLYQLQLSPDPFESDQPPSPQELLSNFSHEPTIGQVREAAIRYAEVHPDKILRWRRHAALQALLPTVNFGVDHGRSNDISIDEGSFPNYQFIQTEDRDSGFDLSVTWQLSELIWNQDQTSIDTRSKLMVELRDDIVDEVVRTYYERRRLQITMLTNPPASQQAVVEQELRLQELTALLDGLSGGYFSRSMTHHVN